MSTDTSRTRLMYWAALPALAILIGTVAGCSRGETASAAALASDSVSTASSSIGSPSSIGSSSSSPSGASPAVAPQSGTVVATKAAPGKTVKATVKTTVTIGATATVEATTTAVPTTATTPAGPFTTPPHSPAPVSPSPPATPSTSLAAPVGSCTVTGGTLTAQYSTTPAYEHLIWMLGINEYDAGGTLYGHLGLTVTGSTTAVITGTASVDTSVVSCQLVSAVGRKF